MRNLSLLTLIVTAAFVSACGPNSTTHASLAGSADVAYPIAEPTRSSPTVVVYKNASCGCCRSWIQHMQSAGFRVRVENVNDLSPIKQRVGVPSDVSSCHTAQVGDYFVEGHVPAEDVKRLLAQQPPAKGLVVPGMPVGSPGMPGLPGQGVTYDVLLVALDGSTTVFAHHGG